MWQWARYSFKSVEDLERVLAVLKGYGYIREVETEKQQGPGRRPSQIYEVNPLPTTQKTQNSTDEDEPLDYTPNEPPDPQTPEPGGACVDIPTEEPPVDEDLQEETSNDKPNQDYERITDLARPREVVALLAAEPCVALDLETKPKKHALDPYRGSIRLISLASPQGTWIIDTEDFESPIKELIPILQSPGLKVAHNWFFDTRFLQRAIGVFPEHLFDTYLASRVLFADDDDRHGLEDVAERGLGITLDKSFQKADYSKPLTEAHYQYSARDAAIPLRLYPILKEEIHQKGLDDILDLEHRILPHFLHAWWKGTYLDWDGWAKQSVRLADSCEELAAAVNQELPKYLSMEEVDQILAGIKTRKPGTVVNWGAPEQVRPILNKLEVTVSDCQIKTLKVVETKHPIMPHVIAYRKALALYNRLQEKHWVKHKGPDNRIHPTWKQWAAKTGRTSCADPNLQSVPGDPEVRALFIPEPGNALVIFDFSSIEPRVLAAICRDENLLEAFRRGFEPYCWAAALLLDKPVEEINHDGWERKWGKVMFLATVYGQSARSLATAMSEILKRKVSEQEAAGHLDKFYKTFPKVAEYSKRQKSLLRSGGMKLNKRTGEHYPIAYAETSSIRGRKRIVRDYPSRTEREALNSPIQSSACDAAKETLAILWETRENSGGAFLTMFVHDEFVLEVPNI